jgi:glucose/arabinose dehydrogenase
MAGMRLGVYGWATVATIVVLGLAGVVVRRPIIEALEGGPSSAVPGNTAPAARVRFEPVASGFTQPVDLQFIPGSGRRAVVLEKGGRARLLDLTGTEVLADSARAGAGIVSAGAAGSVGAGGAGVVSAAAAGAGGAGIVSAAAAGAGGAGIVSAAAAGAGGVGAGGAGVAGAGAAGAAGSLPGGLASPGADVFTVDVHTHSELGLLGLAFHPSYQQNGLFYLDLNPRDAGPLRTRISEWQLPREALGREPAREKRVLLEINQPFPNHDGGQVAFGPDGYLYIGMGDGGSRADPQGHGQNLGSLLGKMLRIDVDSSPGYKVPADNPFVSTPGAKPEIWAYGLRNPWRFSFDPKGRLIAADVGQDEFEEVSIVAAGNNMGWAVREARHCFPPGATCQQQGMVDPIFEYGRPEGASISGGHVYLGERLPWLKGKYVFADFVSGLVWALDLPERADQPAHAEIVASLPSISGFGRAPDGELYALDFARGLVLWLLPA